MEEQTGSYVASEMPGGLDKELARLRGQALQWWDKEARVLAGFGLHDGMAVLEPGAGPGFVTGQLLNDLPTSQITVVERDPTLIPHARAYLADKGGERVEFVEASVMATGLPADQFDFAIARLLFQHLPDPVGAAREIYRVLKPGGKLVIIDPDDKLHLFDPPPAPEAEAVSDKISAAQAARGGNRHVGRRLPRILKEAGFQHLDLAAIMVHSDIYGIAVVDPKGQPEDLVPLVERGIITEAERAVLWAAIEEFYASDPLVILTMLAVCGTKA